MEPENPKDIIIDFVSSLPYNTGKSLLVKVLFGDKDEQIIRLKLHKTKYFGALGQMQKEEIKDMIDSLIFEGSLEIERNQKTRFLPLVKVGSVKRDCSLLNASKEEIPTQDFTIYGGFLDRFNEEQKRAITSGSSRILCMAGAGSGKTTVLTKRIEFLIEKESIAQNKILAITFTRKARQEMKVRIEEALPKNHVNVHTFNSFSENILRRYADLKYGNRFRIMNFPDKINIASKALMEIGLTPDEAMESYYEGISRNGISDHEMFLMMLNDIYSIIDSYKNNGKDLVSFENSSKKLYNGKNRRVALLCSRWAIKIEQIKKREGLRDFTDQMVHCIDLFKKNPETVPSYSHILVDEFQDVNSLQVKLLDILNPDKLFAVGDPRQSIFGWRGSKIEYIMSFKNYYPGSEIIELSRNYRSSPEIVSLANSTILPMRLTPLIAELPPSEDVSIIRHNGEEEEALFVAQAVLNSSILRNEIFVLARTNKQLEAIGTMFDRFQISYLKRTVEEEKHHVAPSYDEVTLSTIHAIKGLEADMVFLIGANTQNYPCRKEEHPILEIAKTDDYDKYSEEIRVFYVGITRARKKLVISYYNRLTRFIDPKERKSKGLMERLVSWRMKKAKEGLVPPEFILSDKTILDISRYRPESLSELEESGLLDKEQIENYGKEIIRITSRPLELIK